MAEGEPFPLNEFEKNIEHCYMKKSINNCLYYTYMIYIIYIFIYIYIYCVRWKRDIIGYYVQLCSIITKKYPSKEMNCGGAEVAVMISR